MTPDERLLYTSIIDGILNTADLTTVTRKKIRAGLENGMGGKDLSAQKVAPSLLPIAARQASDTDIRRTPSRS